LLIAFEDGARKLEAHLLPDFRVEILVCAQALSFALKIGVKRIALGFLAYTDLS
jgi:hypothetical protein